MSDNMKTKRQEILNRLIRCAKECQTYYGGRKELATEKDDVTMKLLDALEDAFFFGLKEQETSLPVAIFQNVQEIVSGNITRNDPVLWNFCEKHLTNHERERFNGLKSVSTKCGKVKAFIRASLNENSLRRYILTWLDDPGLEDIYEPWAFMVDPEAGNLLPSIAAGLNSILFALTVDTPEINVSLTQGAVRKLEPIIYAPSPIGSLKKTTVIKRPIATIETDDVVKEFLPNSVAKNCLGAEEVAERFDDDAPKPEVQYEPECLQEILDEILSKKIDEEVPILEPVVETTIEPDAKSETSSQSSKSSSAFSSANAYRQQSTLELEQKLQDMSERCTLLETRVAQLSLENRQLRRMATNAVTETTANFLITIPLAKLVKARSRNYYSYEVHITMRDKLEHWMVMRRYREFHKLHKYLKSMHPGISTVGFPPKKPFGNMNRLFVEERRQQLQIYLIDVMAFLPQVEACRNKEDLQKIFPFFQDR